MQSTREGCTVHLFPLERHTAWRVIEATALRRAGGANGQVNAAISHLAVHWFNVPSELLDPALTAARRHIDQRVSDLRAAVGTAPLNFRAQPAEIIPLPPARVV